MYRHSRGTVTSKIPIGTSGVFSCTERSILCARTHTHTQVVSFLPFPVTTCFGAEIILYRDIRVVGSRCRLNAWRNGRARGFYVHWIFVVGRSDTTQYVRKRILVCSHYFGLAVPKQNNTVRARVHTTHTHMNTNTHILVYTHTTHTRKHTHTYTRASHTHINTSEHISGIRLRIYTTYCTTFFPFLIFYLLTRVRTFIALWASRR